MEKNYSRCVLFLCDTYMQLITAIQIKLKLLQEIDADIILTDHSQKMEKISRNLKEFKLFRRVKLVKTKLYTYEQGIMDDVKDVLTLMAGNEKKYRDLIWEKNIIYDVIFYHNFSFISYLIYDLSKGNGLKPTCIRFEEGLTSYPAMKKYNGGKSLKIYRFFRLLSGKGDIFKDTNLFFCYCPELFEADTKQKCYKIPFIEKGDKKLIDLLNDIFEYRPQMCRQKYIYFSSSADIDGRNIGEKRIVQQVAKLVGKEKIIIKVHPRDSLDAYREMGLSIWGGPEFPWEIAQLNADFSNKIFVTLSSGSTLSASVMFNEDIETFYLYPCVKGKNPFFDNYCKEIGELLQRLQNIGYCKKHRILSSTGGIALYDKKVCG